MFPSHWHHKLCHLLFILPSLPSPPSLSHPLFSLSFFPQCFLCFVSAAFSLNFPSKHVTFLTLSQPLILQHISFFIFSIVYYLFESFTDTSHLYLSCPSFIAASFYSFSKMHIKKNSRHMAWCDGERLRCSGLMCALRVPATLTGQGRAGPGCAELWRNLNTNARKRVACTRILKSPSWSFFKNFCSYSTWYFDSVLCVCVCVY